MGGGIHASTKIGDVVVATRVVYYDLRKETPEGTRRRGEEREAPSAVGHAVNAFFNDHGEPATLQAANDEGDFLTHTGPIGSGEAVIADAKSEIIRYLKAYNDKVLAVEMEAGGLTQAFHEQDGPQAVRGWVVVRGISDDADDGKNDTCHDVAARHAATVLRSLLPYLPIGSS
ncbi:5'-methylthioadenosine/S-adenosylhomocysteine nucleosidase [Nonomuraea basaltis]|nr:5'-methylthioadenosine/S-adenosylhomocysteine nucleosidase [Nonomuraea basaltis]